MRRWLTFELSSARNVLLCGAALAATVLITAPSDAATAVAGSKENGQPGFGNGKDIASAEWYARQNCAGPNPTILARSTRNGCVRS